MKTFDEFQAECALWGQVKGAPKVDSQQILSFCMDKNTPERKDYIMENPVEMVEGVKT